MKKQFYFEDEDSEICYTKDYFIRKMKEEGVTEKEVIKAYPDKLSGMFWCKKHDFCGDGTEDYCGKQCKDYAPRNGKSGCCKNHTSKLYIHGEKINLTL